MVKKIATWCGIAFLIFFIAYRPSSASGVFQSIGSTVVDIGEGFKDFFINLIA